MQVRTREKTDQRNIYVLIIFYCALSGHTYSMFTWYFVCCISCIVVLVRLFVCHVYNYYQFLLYICKFDCKLQNC